MVADFYDAIVVVVVVVVVVVKAVRS